MNAQADQLPHRASAREDMKPLMARLPKGTAALNALWSAIEVGLSAAFAWGVSQTVSRLADGAHDIVLTVFFVALGLGGKYALTALRTRLEHRLARRVVRTVRADYVALAQGGRLSQARHVPGLEALYDDTEALEGFYARFLPATIAARTTPILLLGLIALQSWVCALILLAAMVPFIAFMALVGLGSASEARRQLDALARLSNLFADRIRALPLIYAFDAARHQTAQMSSAAKEVAERTLRVLRLAFAGSAVLEFFAALSIALIAVYCGFSLLGELPFTSPESLTLAEAFFVLALAPDLFAPMRRLSAAYHDRQQATAAMRRLNELTPSPPREPQRLKAAPTIVFDNVVAGFEDDPDLRIGPVTFALEPGEVLALRGPSGSGKSTLLRLLLGHGFLAEGDILVDGAGLGDLAGSVALAGQVTPLVTGTLRENLILSAPEATQTELDDLLSAFGLDALMHARTDDLNERGSGLSGGERRRIGLIRAGLSRAPLLLLDEPTADLDEKTARAITAALPGLFKGRTVIMATHDEAVAALATKGVTL